MRYALGLPGVSLAIVGMADESEIDENVRLAENLTPLADGELEPLLDEAKGLLVGDKPSDRSPVLFRLSRSISAMTALRAENSCSGFLAFFSASSTRLVTFSIETSTFTSRSGDFISSAGVAA